MINKHLKEVYSCLLKRDMTALTECLNWTYPAGYKISLYSGDSELLNDFTGQGVVLLHLPSKTAYKTFLLRHSTIIECLREDEVWPYLHR